MTASGMNHHPFSSLSLGKIDIVLSEPVTKIRLQTVLREQSRLWYLVISEHKAISTSVMTELLLIIANYCCGCKQDDSAVAE